MSEKIRSTPRLKKICAAPSGTVIIIGYPHVDETVPDGILHVYRELDGSERFEFPEGAIVDEFPPASKSADDPTTFFVHANAEVAFRRTATAVEQAQFLAGASACRWSSPCKVSNPNIVRSNTGPPCM